MAHELPERGDPVLVRPYISTEPGNPKTGDDRSAQTWPETADLPEDGTRELPAVPAEPVPAADPGPARSSVLLRQRLSVIGGVVVLALLGGLVYLLFAPSDQEDPPAVARPTAAAPGVSGSLGAAPAASSAALDAPPTSRGTSKGPSAAASAPVLNLPAPDRTATDPTPSGTPTATLAPPPGTARTGAITAESGRCLNLASLLAIAGEVQTTGCADVAYQRWTLDTDGTLRVAGRCAQVSSDETIDIGGCDDRPAAQWRVGPGGSLVNPASGQCLTDPGRAGTTTTVTACTGAGNQVWTLP